MPDLFAGHQSAGIEAPAEYAAALSGDDTNDLATFTRALYVGGAGNIKVTTAGGSTVTFTGVTAGSILPIRVKRFWSTGTTATTVLGLW